MCVRISGAAVDARCGGSGRERESRTQVRGRKFGRKITPKSGEKGMTGRQTLRKQRVLHEGHASEGMLGSHHVAPRAVRRAMRAVPVGPIGLEQLVKVQVHVAHVAAAVSLPPPKRCSPFKKEKDTCRRGGRPHRRREGSSDSILTTSDGALFSRSSSACPTLERDGGLSLSLWRRGGG